MPEGLVDENSNIIVYSKFTEADVVYVDFIIQEERKEMGEKFRYYCPICLRYFTHMLLTGCCDNYLCHFCMGDLKTQELKDANFKAGCPFGCRHMDAQDDLCKFELKDVDPTAKIKKYSDS